MAYCLKLSDRPASNLFNNILLVIWIWSTHSPDLIRTAYNLIDPPHSSHWIVQNFSCESPSWSSLHSLSSSMCHRKSIDAPRYVSATSKYTPLALGQMKKVGASSGIRHVLEICPEDGSTCAKHRQKSLLRLCGNLWTPIQPYTAFKRHKWVWTLLWCLFSSLPRLRWYWSSIDWFYLATLWKSHVSPWWNPKALW